MNDRLRDILAADIFIDTNILFYGINIGNPEKYARAGALLEYLWQKEPLPSISTQVSAVNASIVTTAAENGVTH
ncbi:MAG TPA: hypothetical protein PKW28_10570, partial [Turneriella sp.]|nr:hypothetical protein [Turneriella sp.]